MNTSSFGVIHKPSRTQQGARRHIVIGNLHAVAGHQHGVGRSPLKLPSVDAVRQKSLLTQAYTPTTSTVASLVAELGPYCQGCGRDYADDHRVLEVDHIMSKASGGTDCYDNLAPLCPPCTRIKGPKTTLSELRIYNRVQGRMRNEQNLTPLAAESTYDSGNGASAARRKTSAKKR